MLYTFSIACQRVQIVSPPYSGTSPSRVCEFDGWAYFVRQDVPRDDSLSVPDLSQLIGSLLAVGLDPAAAPVALDLDAALTAAVDAFADGDWRAALTALAAAIARVGPSHRQTLIRGPDLQQMLTPT